MGKYDFIKIKKKLSKYLDEARFEHTMGVMYTCAIFLTEKRARNTTP